MTSPLASPASPGAGMRRRLSGFTATLRGAGFSVGRSETGDAARVIASPLADRPERLRAALKALLASNRSEYERFDELFDAFWRGRGVRRAQATVALGIANRARRFEPGPGGTGADGLQQRAQAQTPGETTAEGRGRERGASAQETLARKDFAILAAGPEREAALALAERLARAMRARVTRRERARRKGRRIDLRATLRRSVARGGEPIDLKFRKRKRRPLRIVALLDASGSMEPYVPVFTRFLHALSQAFAQAEAYLFHTRLAHVSSALSERNPQRALDRLSLMAEGVGGGTRIGDCLGDFNRVHAKRVIHSRTCVMIFSDGYDTGEPEKLASEMRALKRRCRRVVWLNPLTGREGFAPVARGMRAALPFVDLFAPAHDLESLAGLERYLARL
ncbi:MAG TPA: VWA domain-containing protein [Roseiarcus sp.]